MGVVRTSSKNALNFLIIYFQTVWCYNILLYYNIFIVTKYDFLNMYFMLLYHFFRNASIVQTLIKWVILLAEQIAL